MTIHIHIDNMKAAEHLSNICKDYPYELSLKADRFCVDPKSTLGILAMMYSAKDKMHLDTGDMADTELAEFMQRIQTYAVPDVTLED